MKLKKILAQVMALAMMCTAFASFNVVEAATADSSPVLTLNAYDTQMSGVDYIAVDVSYSGLEGLFEYDSFEEIYCGVSIIQFVMTNDADLVLKAITTTNTSALKTVSECKYSLPLSAAGAYLIEKEGTLATFYYYYQENVDVEFSLDGAGLQIKEKLVSGGELNTYDYKQEDETLAIKNGTYTNIETPAEPEASVDATSTTITPWSDGTSTQGVAAELVIPVGATVSKLVYNLLANGGGYSNAIGTHTWDISALVEDIDGVTLGFALNIQEVPADVVITVESVTAQ